MPDMIDFLKRVERIPVVDFMLCIVYLSWVYVAIVTVSVILSPFFVAVFPFLSMWVLWRTARDA